MLEDRILVAVQSGTWQLKRLCDSQRSNLALAGLDGRSKRPDPISWLIISGPSTNMIVLTISSKVELLVLLFTFFKVYFVFSWDSKVHNSASSFFLLIIIRSGRPADIR